MKLSDGEKKRNELGNLCDWLLDQLEYAIDKFYDARELSDYAPYRQKLEAVMQASTALHDALKAWGGWYPVPGAGPMPEDEDAT